MLTLGRPRERMTVALGQGVTVEARTPSYADLQLARQAGLAAGLAVLRAQRDEDSDEMRLEMQDSAAALEANAIVDTLVRRCVTGWSGVAGTDGAPVPWSMTAWAAFKAAYPLLAIALMERLRAPLDLEDAEGNGFSASPDGAGEAGSESAPAAAASPGP